MCAGDTTPHTSPRVRVTRSLLVASEDGIGRAYDLPAGHSLVEVLAEWDSGVSAGDVTLQRIDGDDHGNIAAPRASLTYSAAGAAWQGEVAPGSAVRAVLSGYAGAGNVRVVVTSWVR